MQDAEVGIYLPYDQGDAGHVGEGARLRDEGGQSVRTRRLLALCVGFFALLLPAPALADDGLPSTPDAAAAVDAALASQPELSAPETSSPVSADDIAASVDQAVQQTVQDAVSQALASQDAVRPAAPDEPA